MSEPEAKRQKTLDTTAAGSAPVTGRGASARAAGGRVVLNVGGEEFTTSRMTLVLSSTYFERLFSREWNGDTEEGAAGAAIFVDQDPGPFRVLLSYMRLGKVRAAALTPAVLLQAQFLGMDRLLEAVRLVARREAFMDSDASMLYAAAKSAGVLDGSEEIRKEFAELSISNPTFTCFEGDEDDEAELQDKDFFVSVCTVRPDANAPDSAPSDSDSSSSGGRRRPRRDLGIELHRGNFIDCLNFAHSNGYVKFEEQVSYDVLDHNFHLVKFFFSRLVEREGADDIASIIIHEGNSLFEKREFAAQFQWARPQRTPQNESEEYIVADDGEEPITRHLNTMGVRGREIEVRSHRIEKLGIVLMDWLQREGYVQRETQLQSLYYESFQRAAARSVFGSNGELADGELNLSVWSRRRRDREEDGAAEAAEEST